MNVSRRIKTTRVPILTLSGVCLWLSAFSCSVKEGPDSQKEDYLEQLKKNSTSADALQAEAQDSKDAEPMADVANSTATPVPVASVSATATATVMPVPTIVQATPTPVKIEHPPRLSSLSNQAIEFNAVLENISIVIDDPDGPLSCSQALSATSSEQSVLQSPKITFGGEYPNCKMRIEPQVGVSSGRSKVSVVLSDGKHSVSGEFFFYLGTGNITPQISVGNSLDSKEDSVAIVNFEVSDPDGPLKSCQTERFKYESSNADLVKSMGAIVFEGTWPKCNAKMTPVPDQWGRSTIRISYNDGISESQLSEFIYNVANVDDVPVIESTIDATLTLNEDGSKTFDFKVHDKGDKDTLSAGQSCANDTFFQKTSSNLILMPLDRIVFSGTFPDCKVTLSPAPNKPDHIDVDTKATVALFFKDADLYQATKTIILTVNPVNDVPEFITNTSAMFNFANRTIAKSASTEHLFYIRDVDAKDINCSHTLNSLSATSDNANLGLSLAFSNNGENCILKTTAGTTSGTATVTVSVTDGTATTSKTFTLTVNP